VALDPEGGAPLGGRLVSASPEFFASAAYLVAWIAPGRMDPAVVRGLVLAMLVEFLVVHASGFLGISALAGERVARLGRAAVVLGLALLYLLFAGAMGLAFRSWTPVATIGWLAGSRLVTVLVDPRDADAERSRQAGLWAASGALYVVFAILTAVLPIPRLGIRPDVVARLALPGSGLWIEQPQVPLAFGFLYFAAFGLVELRSRASGAPLAARRPAGAPETE